MRLFISWSGPAAQGLAEALKDWLHTVLGGQVSCFVSSQDIAKGGRGSSVLAEELAGTSFGLLVLTRANVVAPWVNFEAGALSKAVDRSRVVPMLVDLDEVPAGSPLAQFQRVRMMSPSDFRQFVGEVNLDLDHPLPEQSLRVLFDSEWPKLEQSVAAAASRSAAPEAARSESDRLNDLMSAVEAIAHGQNRVADRIRALEDRVRPSIGTIRPAPEKTKRRPAAEPSPEWQVVGDVSRASEPAWTPSTDPWTEPKVLRYDDETPF